jgi:hypothetical protein
MSIGPGAQREESLLFGLKPSSELSEKEKVRKRELRGETEKVRKRSAIDDSRN